MEKKASKHEFLKVQQIALRLKVSVNLIYKLISEGKLKATRIGSCWRIREDVLEFFIDENTI